MENLKAKESLSSKIVRYFVGTFFLLSGFSGFYILFTDSTAFDTPLPFITVICTAIGALSFFPETVGNQYKTFFKWIALIVSKAFTKWIMPPLSKLGNKVKTRIGQTPVPSFLKRISDAIDAEAVGNEVFFSSAWYIRYPLAAIAVSIAIALASYALDASSKVMALAAWLGVAMTGVYALIYARELIFIFLGGLFLFGAFKCIAALPVSAAIIIGAIIIACAVYRKA